MPKKLHPMLGIFDSGVGGLSVVRELLRRSPRASFLYLGDTARTPYGNKSPETIRQYAEEDARFLMERGATQIVVACNTVSSVAMDHLRATFPSVRFFDVITPAVAAAVTLHAKKIGVIGTRATIRSGVYEKMIHAALPSSQVINAECPLFVPLVEEGWTRKPETRRIARTYLQPLRQKQADALILGCTHYPFLLDAIRAAVQRRVKIIDSPSCVLKMILKESPDELQPSAAPIQQYFFTDLTEQGMALVKKWVGKNAEIIKVSLDK